MNEKRPAIISLVHLWHMETLSQPLGPAKNKAAAIAFIYCWMLACAVRLYSVTSQNASSLLSVITFSVIYLQSTSILKYIGFFMSVCVIIFSWSRCAAFTLCRTVSHFLVFTFKIWQNMEHFYSFRIKPWNLFTFTKLFHNHRRIAYFTFINFYYKKWL